METIRLRTRREVAIRPIRPDDAPALQAAYMRLSPETQYRRFFMPKDHLSSGDLKYLTDVDGHDHVALIATPIDQPDRIIAVGRYIRLPEDPLAAEFAIVVGDPFQGEGLATEVLERLADAAVDNGIVRFTASMLAGRLAHERHLGPVDEVEVELAA